MKILGIKQGSYSGIDGYIVEISVSELKMVANKAGYQDKTDLEKLKPGDEYPIADGYNFRQEIVAATKSMQTAYDSFQKASATMTRFAALVADKGEG